jgi:hypothetical protein
VNTLHPKPTNKKTERPAVLIPHKWRSKTFIVWRDQHLAPVACNIHATLKRGMEMPFFIKHIKWLHVWRLEATSRKTKTGLSNFFAKKEKKGNIMAIEVIHLTYKSLGYSRPGMKARKNVHGSKFGFFDTVHKNGMHNAVYHRIAHDPMKPAKPQLPKH